MTTITRFGPFRCGPSGERTMSKPECFRVGCVTSCNMPYGIDETSRQEIPSTGGVLKKGQPVWLKESLTGRTLKTFVLAYVEHLGVVSLDARFLVDFSNPVDSTRQSNGTQESHYYVDVARST
jgi:hypothetical protein